MLKEKYEFELFPDYYQFYLQDEQTIGDLSDSWLDRANEGCFALVPGTISVATVQNRRDVPVIVEIHDGEPENNFDEWDWVIDISIDIPSGKIVVAGCTDYFPDAARISVEPGSYRARVFYGELNSVSVDDCEGNDKYKVALWLGEAVNPKFMKRYAKD
jgi:hypothetical protein